METFSEDLQTKLTLLTRVLIRQDVLVGHFSVVFFVPLLRTKQLVEIVLIVRLHGIGPTKRPIFEGLQNGVTKLFRDIVVDSVGIAFARQGEDRGRKALAYREQRETVRDNRCHPMPSMEC